MNNIDILFEKYHLDEGHEFAVEHQEELVGDLTNLFYEQLKGSKLKDIYEVTKHVGFVFSSLSKKMSYGKFLPNFIWQHFYKEVGELIKESKR